MNIPLVLTSAIKAEMEAIELSLFEGSGND
jgi:hypothetical protein